MHLRFAAILVFAFGMIGIVVARPFDGRDRRAERSAMSTDHDWPQWQGPDRTGLSKETGLLQQWPASGPAAGWSAAGPGGGCGSLAIKGERIFVQGPNGPPSLL